MSITRPRGEQIVFSSSKTGDHILDTYLEAVERGSRTISELVDEIINSSGNLRTDIFEFRETPAVNGVLSGILQARVGTFVDPAAGWTDISSSDYATFVTDCQAAQTAAETAQALSQDWAEKTSGAVTGTSYSAKHWATTGTVQIVSTNIADINTTADDIASVNTTATSIANVNIVAPNIANVNKVGAIDTNVTTVANNDANVTIVATNDTDISTVAAISTNVTTVAGISADVTSAVGISANITTVATNIANVNTAASISADITTAASIAAAISTNATNITAIQAADANATTATTQAGIATTKASEASASATASANSASSITNAETNSANSATAAAASLDSFTDIYLGTASSNPTTDLDGNALVAGALHYNTTANSMRVYDGASWADAGSAVNGTSNRAVYVATAAQTSFAAIYNAGYVDVYLNGIKLQLTVDYDGTSGTAIVLTTGATVGDIIDIIAFGSFSLADHYSKVASDARYELLDTSYTKAEGDARFEPIDSAYTKSEGDARYEPIDSAYTKAEADAKIVELSPPATKTHVESLGIAASSITGALPAIDASNLTGIDTLPTQSSQTGKYLTTNGTAASWGEIAAGGNVADFVASGTLPDGKAVVLKADGTVEIISEVTVYSSTTTKIGTNTFNSGATYYTNIAFDPNTSGKFVIAYRDSGNSHYGTAIAGTMTGTSLSFGSEVVFMSDYIGYLGLSFDPNTAGRFVVVYTDDGQAYPKGYAKIGSLSGSSISFGSQAVFSSSQATYISVDCDPNTSDKLVVAYRNHGGNFSGQAKVGTISGTSVSFGSAATFNSGAIEYTSVVFDPNNTGKCIIACRNMTGSNRGEASIGTLSGTSISFGSPVTFNSGDTEVIDVAMDPTSSGRFLITYQDAGNGSYGTVVAGTISGTSLSVGSEVVFKSVATSNIYCAFDQSSSNSVGKHIITYSFSSGGYYAGRAVSGTLSGTSISLGSVLTLNSTDTYYPALASNPNSFGNFVVAYSVGSGNTGKASTLSVTTSTSNLTSTNFLGTSTAAYTNGQTATIALQGGISTNQSGLTAGSTYYVQPAGTLATSAGSPSVEAGKAVNATTLLLKGI